MTQSPGNMLDAAAEKENGFPRLLAQARNDKVSDSRSNYRPFLSLRGAQRRGNPFPKQKGKQ